MSVQNNKVEIDGLENTSDIYTNSNSELSMFDQPQKNTNAAKTSLPVPASVFHSQDHLTHHQKLEYLEALCGALLDPIRMAWNIQKCIKKWKWETCFGGEKKFGSKKKKMKKNLKTKVAQNHPSYPEIMFSREKRGRGRRGVVGVSYQGQLDNRHRRVTSRVAPCSSKAWLKREIFCSGFLSLALRSATRELTKKTNTFLVVHLRVFIWTTKWTCVEYNVLF